MSTKYSYTVPEVLRITGIGRTTLYAEISADRLRAVKLGRRTLILAEDLQRWLAALPCISSEVAR
jgi:excisionase family DNA binding protein